MLKFKIPDKLKLKIGFITFSFDTTNTWPLQWILLAISVGILNIFIWPYILATAVNAVFATQLDWTNINVFVGIWVLILSLQAISGNFDQK